MGKHHTQTDHPPEALRFTDEQVAETCHEMIRGYDSAIGTATVQPPWQGATAEQRNRILEAVRHARRCATPRERHEAWRAEMAEAGWTEGDIRDWHLKRHPNMVPWERLDRLQRLRYELFLLVAMRMMMETYAAQGEDTAAP